MNEYKIKVDGNRVIFDGHAEDLETCNAITQICNALKQTLNTIEYKEGYAEFEVDEAEEKMFPFTPGAELIEIKNNSGLITAIYTPDGEVKLNTSNTYMDLDIFIKATIPVYNGEIE